MFTADFFKNNRSILLNQLTEPGILIITAQSLLQRSADTTYPFRQDSNFYYLTGLVEPDLVLVISNSKEFIILPKRTEVETIFGGSIDRDEIAKISGVMTIYSHSEGWNRYKKLQQSSKNIYTLGQNPTKVSGADSFFTNSARKVLIQKIKRISPNAILHDIRPNLGKLRQIKLGSEIKAIEKAIDVTAEGFKQVSKMLEPGIFEYELEATFDQVFKSNASSHAYQPIIAAGKNACVLHYIKNNQKIEQGDLTLFDVGAEFNYYAADISRTYCAGEMTKRQRQVIDSVKKVQDLAISYLKPGVQWKDYALFVESVMGEELVYLGLLNKVSKSGVRKYFPHGISHSLGLDVHDVCDYKQIQENMVITVEPGIYIPEEGIGVRIEDNILITKNGTKNLSAHIDY